MSHRKPSRQAKRTSSCLVLFLFSSMFVAMSHRGEGGGGRGMGHGVARSAFFFFFFRRTASSRVHAHDPTLAWRATRRNCWRTNEQTNANTKSPSLTTTTASTTTTTTNADLFTLPDVFGLDEQQQVLQNINMGKQGVLAPCQSRPIRHFSRRSSLPCCVPSSEGGGVHGLFVVSEEAWARARALSRLPNVGSNGVSHGSWQLTIEPF
jgi:hypothetical protein